AAEVGGAPILPDNGGMDGPPRGAVPHHHGLALVGDADGGNAAGADAARREHLTRAGDGVVQDARGIMLDPARPGIALRQLTLRGRQDAAAAVEKDGTGTARA